MLLLALYEPFLLRRCSAVLHDTRRWRRLSPRARDDQLRFAHAVEHISLGPRRMAALLRATSPTAAAVGTDGERAAGARAVRLSTPTLLGPRTCTLNLNPSLFMPLTLITLTLTLNPYQTSACAVADPTKQCLWDDELNHVDWCRTQSGGYCLAVRAAIAVARYRTATHVQPAERGCGHGGGSQGEAAAEDSSAHDFEAEDEGEDDVVRLKQDEGRMFAALVVRMRYL